MRWLYGFIVAVMVLGAGPLSVQAAFQQENIRVHAKDFSVITVGTGTPGLTPARAETMSVIQYRGNYLVVDCGNGTAAKFLQNSLSFKRINMMLFTHLHLDHAADFNDVMVFRAAYGGQELTIAGPPRTRQLYEFFREFYRDDVLYRAQVMGNTTSRGLTTGITVQEMTGFNQFNFDGVAIESAEMVHTMYDLAYKFTLDGKSIVIAGDTSYNENLVALAKDSDVLVLSAGSAAGALRAGGRNDRLDSAAIGQRLLDGQVPQPLTAYAGNYNVKPHADYSEIIKIAKETQVKTLVLSHLLRPQPNGDDPMTPEVCARVQADLKQAGFMGEVIFASDGLEVSP